MISLWWWLPLGVALLAAVVLCGLAAQAHRQSAALATAHRRIRAARAELATRRPLPDDPELVP